MTQDTKYLDAYIKYKFNISKVLEKISFKGWNKVVEWYESEKYKKIINSKEIEVYFIENLYDDLYHIDNNFGKLSHVPGEKVTCFGAQSVRLGLITRICEEFINSDLSKYATEKFCDRLSNDYDNYAYGKPDYVLTEDPFFKEYLKDEERSKSKKIKKIYDENEIDLPLEINKIRKSLKFQFSDNFQIEGELSGDSLRVKYGRFFDLDEEEELTSLKISPQEEEFLLKGFINPNQTKKQKRRIIEKRGAFRNLAQSRIVAALDSIRKISNCSNKSHYTFTYEEIKEMRDTLVDKINEEFSKFGFVKDKSLEIKIGDKKSKETTFQQQIKNPKGNVLEIELESLKKSMHEKFRELELKINLSEENKKE